MFKSSISSLIFFQIFILNIEKGMLNSPTVIVNLSVSQFNFFSFCFMSTWSFNTKGTCIVKYYFSQWMNLNISVYYFFPCLIFIPALIYSNGLYLLFYILGLTVLRSGLRGSKLFVVSSDFHSRRLISCIWWPLIMSSQWFI